MCCKRRSRKICEQKLKNLFFKLCFTFEILNCFIYFRVQGTKLSMINLLLVCKYNKLEKWVANQLEKRNFQILINKDEIMKKKTNTCRKKKDKLRKKLSTQKFMKDFPLLHKEKVKEKSRSRKERRSRSCRSRATICEYEISNTC